MMVKIQRSLFSNTGDMMLIYNRTQSIYLQKPLSSQVKRLLGDDVKGYFHAKYL